VEGQGRESVYREHRKERYLAIGLAQAALAVVGVDHLHGRLAIHLERAKHVVVYFSQEQFSIVGLMAVCANEVDAADDGGDELAHATTISHDLRG
jgi:hypothetical protein